MTSIGSKFRHRHLAGAALAAIAVASPSYAQQAVTAAAPAPAEAHAESGGLTEIVVTARRRTESVQDIPVAVQAIGAAVIESRDLTSLEKIAAATPQFTVARASNGSGAQLTLRGIGSSATSIGIEQSVAIVVDGVYYGQGRIINEGFFDLARVEILKGPQSLFFGKNATAGVISLTTADPTKKREFIGRIGYEAGAQQLYGEAIASGPLSDTLGLRIAVRGSKMFEGYYKNSADPTKYNTFDIATGALNQHTGLPSDANQPQERELIGRVTLKYEPTDRLTVTLKGSGSFNETVGNGWNYSAIKCVGGVTTLNANYKCDGGFDIHQNAIPVDIAKVYPYSRSDGELYNKYKSYQGTGTINYNLDNVALTSITNYNWNNNKFACDCDFLGGGVWATENSTYHAFSEELRALTTFDSPVNLMFGGLYQKTRRDFFQAVMFAGIENSTVAPENRYVAYSKISATDGETLSGYGQAIWKVVPTVEFTAGVRYVHETKVSYFTQPYVNGALTGIFKPQSAAVNGTLYGDQTFDDWSPDVTLSWKPNRDIMVYGAYKTAYKSGGFSNSAINSALATNPAAALAFNPEKGRGFEAGIKTTLADNQLRANLSLYTFNYTDLQVDYFDAQIFAYVTYNAGSARSKGAELELEYAPRAVAGLTLHGSLNYNSSRYKNFLAPCYSGQSIAAGCSLNNGAGVPLQDLNGVPTAVAPKWTGTAGLAYESDISSSMKFGGNIDLRYSASYLGSGFGNPWSEQSAYAVVDGGIRVGSQDDRWQVALIGKNLTNKFYSTGGGTAPLTGSGTGTANAVPGDVLGYGAFPRTVRLQFTVKY
jgi:iron complex outermembrane receptor protein